MSDTVGVTVRGILAALLMVTQPLGPCLLACLAGGHAHHQSTDTRHTADCHSGAAAADRAPALTVGPALPAAESVLPVPGDPRPTAWGAPSRAVQPIHHAPDPPPPRL